MSRTKTPDTESASSAAKSEDKDPAAVRNSDHKSGNSSPQTVPRDGEQQESLVTESSASAVQLQTQQPEVRPVQQEIQLQATAPTPDRSPTPTTPVTDKSKMNGLSFSELCCLFCWPPCPGQIAAKLAFLPPEATYSFIPDETNTKFTLSLTERAEWQYSSRELEAIEVFYTRTSRGNRIGCMFIRAANPRFTIVFSHGNAVDLGQMSSFYLGLGSRINCNIFSYDYSGYGVSSGESADLFLSRHLTLHGQALPVKRTSTLTLKPRGKH